jgi:hypothetical protein
MICDFRKIRQLGLATLLSKFEASGGRVSPGPRKLKGRVAKAMRLIERDDGKLRYSQKGMEKL